jgi:anti-sigma B factor antagonist
MSNPQSDAVRVVVERPPGRANVLIIKLEGELGIGAMVGEDGSHTGLNGDSVFDEQLRAVLPPGKWLVVLDLTGLTYLSSIGMASLIRLQKRVREGGGSLRLSGVSKMLMALLERCRLEKAFDFYPDMDAALSAVSPRLATSLLAGCTIISPTRRATTT